MNTTFLLIGSAAGGLAGAAYLFRSLRWLVRTLDALLALASKELNPNGGNSMKDDTANTVRATAAAHRRIDHLAQEVSALRDQVNTLKGTP